MSKNPFAEATLDTKLQVQTTKKGKLRSAKKTEVTITQSE